MAEYIDKQVALESVREKLRISEALPDSIAKRASVFTLASMNDSLKSIPAADVRPVVHGKWIMNDDSKDVCSLCGNVVAFVSHPDKRWDFGYFCPNCGADMREES